MKKTLIISIALIGILFVACHKSPKVEKDVHNYFPKVKTLSVQKLPNGTVKVTGLVVSEGSTPVVYAGFCMDTAPNPDMTSNQVIVNAIYSDTFSYIYSGLKFPQKYYFRAWVGNGNAYAIGSDTYADSIAFDTALIPCRPQLQYMTLTGATGTLHHPYTHDETITQNVDFGYDVQSYTGYHNIKLSFDRWPVSGIYKTSRPAFTDSPVVIVQLDDVKSDTFCTVYVQQLNSSTIEVTICSLPVNLETGIFGTYEKFDMATRFQASF